MFKLFLVWHTAVCSLMCTLPIYMSELVLLCQQMVLGKSGMFDSDDSGVSLCIITTMLFIKENICSSKC